MQKHKVYKINRTVSEMSKSVIQHDLWLLLKIPLHCLFLGIQAQLHKNPHNYISESIHYGNQ